MVVHLNPKTNAALEVSVKLPKHKISLSLRRDTKYKSFKRVVIINGNIVECIFAVSSISAFFTQNVFKAIEMASLLLIKE